ncbi:MAG TPA: MBL fold metallo-hydrolase [Nitrospinota bacterium]|jgi:phosphoribosyl 1,2-cyclic phosphodiesterase|nr:MBL fold metallo-hydrolase [Nitrospinota bacterium]
MKIKFWGVRGSIPSPSPSTVKIGGNTSCVEIRFGNDIFIVDCGTGIRELGQVLTKELPVKARIFFSHVHWDHIQGFPFFAPAYIPGNEFQLFGLKNSKHSLQSVLEKQMSGPNFPVSFNVMNAKFIFTEISAGEIINIDDLKVTAAFTNHPNNGLCFRFEGKKGTVVYASDTEHIEGKLDENILSILHGADYFIYDSQFSDDEYSGKIGFPRKGWGHSTWTEGIKLSKKAGVKHFILFHHDPTHTDEFLRKREQECRTAFPNSVLAYEGLEIDINKNEKPISIFDL